MKRKKMIAILTLMCFMFTLMPVAAMATDATTLKTDLEVTDVKLVTVPIVIDGNVTISGGGTIKRAEGYTGALLNVPAGSTLTLKNITIDGGAIWSGEENVSLKRGISNTGLTAKDAAVRVEGGTLNLEDGAKVQNNDNTAVRTNLYFHSETLARYYMMGGGIAVYGGKVVMNAAAVVKDNAVRNTLPEGYGIYAEGITEGNSDSVGGGIGIYENGTFIMNGGTITGNHATNGNNAVTTNSRGMGGGIGAISRVGENQQNSVKIDIKGGSIEKNVGLQFGGGIYTSVDQGDSALRLDCMNLNVAGTISANEVNGNNSNDGAGGGICSNYTQVTISKGAVISDNTAYNSGGGVRLGSSSVLTMDGGTISGNEVLKTDGWGGGIYLNAGGITSPHMINGGTITGNSAASGGGIASSKDPVEIKDVEITNNTAANGGGMNMANANVDLKNVVITGNRATATGGGIVGNGGTTTISNVTIESNTASTDGGGIHANNTLKMLEGGSVANNTAVNGGGLYLSGIKEGSELNGWTIKGNMATSESATHVNGGGLFITGQAAPFAIKNCEITENEAKDATSASNGGALYLSGTSVMMENNNIHENTAQSNGGVMFVNNAKVYMDGDRLTGNKATNGSGGAIYIASSGKPMLSVKNAVNITGNTAKDAENNVYLNNKHITLGGALTAGAAIGVTTATTPANESPVQITTAETDTTYYTDAVKYFVADTKPASGSGSYIAQANANKYVELALSNTTNYKVTLELTNVTTDGAMVTQVEADAPFSAKLTAAEGYTLPTNFDGLKDGVLTITAVTADIIITVAGVPNAYTIAFDGNDATSGTMEPQEMTYDTAADLPENKFAKVGYNFAGWSTTQSGNCEYPNKASVKNLTTVNGETITLYAVWTTKATVPTFAGSVQTYYYDGTAKAYKLTTDLDGFTITYKQGDTVVANPTERGSYDVVIARAEDDTYAAFGQTITDGLVITNRPSGGGFTGVYNYPVVAPEVDGADVTLSDDNAVAGETVTITVTPDEGKQVRNVIVTDADGNVIPVTKVGANEYTFTMPEGKVNIVITTKTADYNTTLVLKIDSPYVTINGETVKNDVVPIINAEGRTMLPIRVIAEALGADVDWNPELQRVTITKDGTVIELFIGKYFAYVNGEIVKLDTVAFIENGRTYLQVRFISELLGCDVDWDAVTRTVTIRGNK